MQSSVNGKSHALTPKRCGAATRSGGKCNSWAMANGRCRMHGGKAGRPIVHGRYSVKHRQSLAHKVESFEQAPIDNLANELAILRALTDDYLSRFEDGVHLPADDILRLKDLLESIGRMVERIAKIRNSTALTAAEVKLIQAGFLAVLQEYVPRDRLKDAIRDLRASIGVH